MKPLKPANVARNTALAFMAALGVCSAQTKPPEPRLPYTTIEHPQFIPAAQASFLHDNDRVIGVMDGKTAKAYGAASLSQHGVAQDQLSSGPIAVTW